MQRDLLLNYSKACGFEVDVEKDPQRYLETVRDSNGRYNAYISEANLGTPNRGDPSFARGLMSVLGKKRRSRAMLITTNRYLIQTLQDEDISVRIKPVSYRDIKRFFSKCNQNL